MRHLPKTKANEALFSARDVLANALAGEINHRVMRETVKQIDDALFQATAPVSQGAPA